MYALCLNVSFSANWLAFAAERILKDSDPDQQHSSLHLHGISYRTVNCMSRPSLHSLSRRSWWQDHHDRSEAFIQMLA